MLTNAKCGRVSSVMFTSNASWNHITFIVSFSLHSHHILHTAE